jgi:RNA polymerase sigma-70 factor (ECF subfamily)
MSVVTYEASTLRANVGMAANPQESDAALVDAVRRHDQEAFEELVTRYGPRIFRLAQKITQNREDAEEVSQDSFAQAFRRVDTFRGDSRFSTWLSRIAVNQSLMKLRSRRWRELQFESPSSTEATPFRVDAAGHTPTPEQLYSQEEVHRILVSAMGGLPTTLREVLYLREVEEYSTRETARMLGLSISAVKSRAVRGRRLMRQALTKYFRTSELAGFPGKSRGLQVCGEIWCSS